MTTITSFSHAGPASPKMRTPDFIRPTSFELAIVCALLFAYIFSDSFVSDAGIVVLNEKGPYLFAGTLILASFRMALITPYAIWTPLFWYRISTAVFFGFGNVAHTWMNWYTFTYYSSFHAVTDADLAKFNVIVAGCHIGVLITLFLCCSWFRPKPVGAPIEFDTKLLKLAALGSCIVGYSCKYLVVLPAAYGVFGPVTEVVIPSMIAQLSMFAPPGLFLLAVLARWEGRAYAIAAFVLLISDLIVGCIGLTKYATLLPLMTYMLAFLFGRVTLARAAIAAGVIVIGFITMQPMIEFGRMRVGQQFGDASGGTPAQRLDLLVEYWTQNTEGDEQMQGALVRVAYMNQVSAAMELYDSGRPGTSLSAITWIFIPRLLWPEKPIYAIGAEFTSTVQGMETTSSWMGFFGEGYYNFGYFGTLIAIPLGIVLFTLSRYAYFVFMTRRWLHLPGVFLGMMIGVQTDNSLVGSAVVFVTVLLMRPVSALATTFLQSVFRGSRGLDLLPAVARRPGLIPSGRPQVLS